MNQNVSMRDLLVAMAERSASDLHITAGAPPTLRVHGHLVGLDYPPLDGEQTKALAYSLINAEQRERFESNHELDFSYGVSGLSRYRVNVYRQRGVVGVALRSIPHQPKSFQELGLPAEICTQLIQRHKGLILVTGPTGHGKTTSMAAMLDRINRERDVHIVTVEDPLEYLFQHQKALVNQREVGSDTHSFPAALKYVLRQDPDVVLIGEMRDLETIQAALTIAETGHLTFATLHTNSCAQSIDRIIDVFPPHQQSQVRAQLALVLEAVFNQLLIPKRDGRGRALAMEILDGDAGHPEHDPRGEGPPDLLGDAGRPEVRDADDEPVAREPVPPRRDLAAGSAVPKLVSGGAAPHDGPAGGRGRPLGPTRGKPCRISRIGASRRAAGRCGRRSPRRTSARRRASFAPRGSSSRTSRSSGALAAACRSAISRA